MTDQGKFKESVELEKEFRPWGYYIVLDEGQGYKVKRIVVNPGQRLSLQSHKHRKEYWIVVEGNPTIRCGDDTREYKTGDTLQIPCEALHRLENASSKEAAIIEVQQGDYLEEDDIIRYEDDYSRT